MRKLQNRSEGFTIIELLIVLAIAALIILIVLIAVPQLQRNQRNTARQNIAGRIATEINNFAGNNNGTLPLATDSGTSAFGEGFADRYLDGVDTNDPSTNTPMEDLVSAYNIPEPTEDAGQNGSVTYGTGRICNGETSTTTDANTRNFALVVRLEGGAGYCLDNS